MIKRALLTLLFLHLSLLSFAGQERQDVLFQAMQSDRCDSLSCRADSIELKRAGLSLRSNLLVPLMNLGIEVPIGKHLSLAGDFYSPWIGFDKANSRCIQAQMANVEVRWWFRQKRRPGLAGNVLAGHSIGIGAFGGHYDFEWNYKGTQGEMYGGYIDYSYTFWLARCLRLSLTLGVGYALLPWRNYTVYSEGGKLIRDDAGHDYVKQWAGPVKAGVTLCVPFFFKTKRK